MYLLDDFTHVQVTAVTATRVFFQARAVQAPLRGRAQRRHLAVEAFRRRVRAEVDPAFFPDFAERAADITPHTPNEAAGLRAALREAARRRARADADPS